MTSRYDTWFNVQPVALILDDNGLPTRLESAEGKLLVVPTRADAESLVAPSPTPTNVSTLTPLTGWLDMEEYRHFLFWLVNLDVTNNVNLLVESSEDQSHADVSNWLVSVTPLAQGSVELADFLKRYWRVSAYTDSPGYPTVAVQYGLKAVPR